jgi:hypothetical protein
MSPRCLVVLAIALASPLTHAESLDPAPTADPVADLAAHLRLSVGGEATFGGDHTASLFRATTGYDHVYGSGLIRPAAGLGVTVGAGCYFANNRDQLEMPQPTSRAGAPIDRATVGADQDSSDRCASLFDFGPELVVGLRIHTPPSSIDTRLYASAAPLLYRIAGQDAGLGVRAAAGMTLVNLYRKLWDAPDAGPSFLLVFMPWQAEVVYEHEAGADRVGFSLAYGI